jgi:hypothetical protein
LVASLGLAVALGLLILTVHAAPGNPVLYPEPYSIAAPPTTTASITYDEAIDAATVSTETFAGQAMQSGLVTGTYGVTSGTIAVTPTRLFFPGELVQVSATTGTLSLGAEGPLTPTVWQFNVAAGLGSGLFAAQPVSPTFRGGDSRDVASGDLDVVVAKHGAETVWQNDGMGRMSELGSFGGGQNRGIALGDVNGDGDLDAVIANDNGREQTVWRNDGAGVFVEGGSFGAQLGMAVALGDLDGDGDLDAVVAKRVDQEERVWLNEDRYRVYLPLVVR